MFNRRVYPLVATPLLFVMLSGCMMEGEDPADVEGTGEALIFNSSTEINLPDSGPTERYASCFEDQVLVGMGGRVDGNGNFTDFSVWCRDVVNGTLVTSGGDQLHWNGGTSTEVMVKADLGWVVVGAAANVGNNNLEMVAVRQCPWGAPGSNRVGVTNSSEVCQWKTNTGSRSISAPNAERVTDSHAGQPIPSRQVRVMRGAGMTAVEEGVTKLKIGYGVLN
jgi:hypothetical protein